MNSQNTSIATSLDFPSYLIGTVILLVVMIFHGAVLLQISKRYEVKTFLYLSEKKYSDVTLVFISAYFVCSSPTLLKLSSGVLLSMYSVCYLL